MFFSGGLFGVFDNLSSLWLFIQRDDALVVNGVPHNDGGEVNGRDVQRDILGINMGHHGIMKMEQLGVAS